jgi:hypothetical protein
MSRSKAILISFSEKLKGLSRKVGVKSINPQYAENIEKADLKEAF